MYRKKTVIMIVMIAALMLMALGYAAFVTKLNINATGNITSTWNIYFSNITEGVIVGSASNNVAPSVSGTTAYFDMNLELPGDSITYEVTLTNGGTVPAIIEDINAVATGSSAIIYSISGIQIGEELAAGENIVITIKVYYDDVMSQPEDTSKTLTITIDAVQDVGQSITESTPSVEQVTQLRSAILKNNTAQDDTSIDFSQISSDTNGKGLYYTSTNTEGNGTTYYFRGAVTNNYVSFADQTWRIVRINEDGSIRLITQNSVETSAFNTNHDDNAYVGYMYGTAGASTYALTHANVNDSTIKTYLDNWYETNLNSYSKYIADAGFCNDRTTEDNTPGYDSSGYATYYVSVNRANNNPRFACMQTNDLFTTGESGKFNKSLIYPIGLLTWDEIRYAGGLHFESNSTYYLNNLVGWWTMTPAIYDSVYDKSYVWMVTSNGSLGSEVVSDTSYYVRPVINLKSDVGITKGDGTVDNPYIISLD